MSLALSVLHQDGLLTLQFWFEAVTGHPAVISAEDVVQKLTDVYRD